MRGELVELARFQRIKHPHVAYRQGYSDVRFAIEQADGAPARYIVLFGDRAFEPHSRTGNQQRMQAWRVAGPFIEQILQTAADFDGENINERVRRRAAEPEPQPVGKGAHACGTGDFQGRCIIFRSRSRPRFQPDAMTPCVGGLEAGWGLRPGPDAFAYEAVECLKTHHFDPFLIEPRWLCYLR
ncbi:hypothetical protein AruPA_09420 [Acidiphilium sp. PA]|nr:hypothetical protein [Acidiphilium sp. PA]